MKELKARDQESFAHILSTLHWKKNRLFCLELFKFSMCVHCIIQSSISMALRGKHLLETMGAAVLLQSQAQPANQQ